MAVGLIVHCEDIAVELYLAGGLQCVAVKCRYGFAVGIVVDNEQLVRVRVVGDIVRVVGEQSLADLHGLMLFGIVNGKKRAVVSFVRCLVAADEHLIIVFAVGKPALFLRRRFVRTRDDEKLAAFGVKDRRSAKQFAERSAAAVSVCIFHNHTHLSVCRSELL